MQLCHLLCFFVLGRAREPEKNHLALSTIVFSTKTCVEVGSRSVTSCTQLQSSGMRTLKIGKGAKDSWLKLVMFAYRWHKPSQTFV